MMRSLLTLLIFLLLSCYDVNSLSLFHGSRLHRLHDRLNTLTTIDQSIHEPVREYTDEEVTNAGKEYIHTHQLLNEGLSQFLKHKTMLIESDSTVSLTNTIKHITIDGMEVKHLRPHPTMNNFIHTMGAKKPLTVDVIVTLQGGVDASDSISVLINGVADAAIPQLLPKLSANVGDSFKFSIAGRNKAGPHYLITIVTKSGQTTEKWNILVEPAEWVAPRVGVEYEYASMQFQLKRDGAPNDKVNAELDRDDTIAQTSDNAIGLPHLGIQMETSRDGIFGLVELVTGAAQFTGNAANTDVYDGYKAMSLFFQVGRSYCQGKPKLLDAMLVEFNKAVDDNKASFSTPGDWKFVLAHDNKLTIPSRYTTLFSDFKKHEWYVGCDWKQTIGNTQVNFGVPLSAFSSRKGVATDFQNPKHFIDLFPENDALDVQQKSMNAAVRRALDVSDHIYHTENAFTNLRNADNISPISKLEARGIIAILLLRIIHSLASETTRNFLSARYADTKDSYIGQLVESYQPGHAGAKNVAINLIKAPVADLTRLCHTQVQEALHTFFMDGNKPRASTVQLLVNSLYADKKSTYDGSLELDWFSTFSRLLESWLANEKKKSIESVKEKYVAKTEQDFHKLRDATMTTALQENLEKLIPIVFKPNAAFSARYDGETDNRFGTKIKNKLSAPDAWKWFEQVGTSDILHALPPLHHLGGWSGDQGQLGVVVESRLYRHTLNMLFTPKQSLKEALDQNVKAQVNKGIGFLKAVAEQI